MLCSASTSSCCCCGGGGIVLLKVSKEKWIRTPRARLHESNRKTRSFSFHLRNSFYHAPLHLWAGLTQKSASWYGSWAISGLFLTNKFGEKNVLQIIPENLIQEKNLSHNKNFHDSFKRVFTSRSLTLKMLRVFIGINQPHMNLNTKIFLVTTRVEGFRCERYIGEGFGRRREKLYETFLTHHPNPYKRPSKILIPAGWWGACVSCLTALALGMFSSSSSSSSLHSLFLPY